MKKLICGLLVLVLLLIGAVGWLAFRKNPYEKYANIFQLLEAGDYAAAVSQITMLQLQGGTHGQQGGENGDSAEPAEEEKKLLDKYYHIYNFLMWDQSSGMIYVLEDDNGSYVSGQEALKYCYETLLDMSVIDKWANSDYVKIYSGIESLDRQALLRNFTVVENVPISIQCTTKDNLENVNTQTVTEWKYSADGVVSEIEGENKAKPICHAEYSHVWLEYDAQGRLVKKTAGWSKNNITAIITYTYDDAGNIIREQEKTNTGEMEYTYTYENGRLSRIKRTDEDGDYRYTLEYTYDASGSLVKEEKIHEVYVEYAEDWATTSMQIMEYTYTDGLLSAGTYTEQDWTWGTHMADWKTQVYEYMASERIDKYTYTLDDQGRVLTAALIPGDTVKGAEGYEIQGEVIETPDYESKTYLYFYGNYYFYSPAQ